MSILKKSFSLLSLFIFCATISIAQTKGLASYYGDAFHGSKTANGEVYDRNQLTGAHKTLPFGTYVKVTRTDNGKSVVVKINDRGPYIKERIVDVSKKAAERLGLIRDGVAPVTLEKVNGPASEATAPAPAVVKAPEPTPTPKTETKPAPKPEPATEIATAPAKQPAPKPAPKKPKVKKEKPAAATPKLKLATSKNYNNFDLYKIQVMRPAKEGFGVQVASFGAYENVMKRVAELQEKHFKNILISVEKGEKEGTVYKIIMGPFEDQKTASAYKRSLAKKHKIKGFTVNLGEIAY